jgi:hypothetical protein
LLEAERRVAGHVATWPTAAQRRLGYRRYCTPPGPHLIRADQTFFAGFVGLLSGPMPVRFDERVFIPFPSDSKLGSHFASHFALSGRAPSRPPVTACRPRQPTGPVDRSGLPAEIQICQDDPLSKKDATFRALLTSRSAGPWMAPVGFPRM